MAFRATTQITLQTTGEIPFEFEGEQIASLSNSYVGGVDRTRYHEVCVYRCEEGGYYLELSWRTRWKGESGFTDAAFHSSLEELVEAIQGVDPLALLIGYPEGQQFEAKQRALKTQISTDWANLRGALFKVLGVTRKAPPRRGKPPHPLGTCSNPGWSIPQGIQDAVAERAKDKNLSPSEVVTDLLAGLLGVLPKEL
jgi:hypothetical protein